MFDFQDIRVFKIALACFRVIKFELSGRLSIRELNVPTLRQFFFFVTNFSHYRIRNVFLVPASLGVSFISFLFRN